ncbi:MAG: HDOD domain-containing protein [Planctomycetota bacterium]
MTHKPLGPVFAGDLHEEIDALVKSSAISRQSPLARRLMQLCGDRSVDTAELAEVLEADPPLAARIIKTANTTRQGAGIPATNTMAAVQRLGRNRCLCLALASEVAESVGRRVESHFDFPRFWRDSLARAYVARTIALQCQSAWADQAFLVALLQDLGAAILATRYGPLYATLLRRSRGSQVRLAVLESQAFKYNHIHVVVRLLERWRAPTLLIEAVGRHHTRPPFQCCVPSRLLLWQLSYFAGAIPIGRDRWPPFDDVTIPEMLLTTFGIEASMIGDMFRRTAQQFADSAGLFRSWLPGDTDVEQLFSLTAKFFSDQSATMNMGAQGERVVVARTFRDSRQSVVREISGLSLGEKARTH